MMEQLGYFFVIFLAIAAVLANIGVCAPRKTWVRICAVAVTALFIPAAYASLSDLLSRPKPVSLEWVHRHAKEATVLGARIEEGKAIYVWLQLPGEAQPRAYALPYNLETAKQLHNAQSAAKKNGSKTKMKKPFKKRGAEKTKEEQFFAPPQPPPPDKASKAGAPVIMPQPGSNG
jgi:hypothetical protein